MRAFLALLVGAVAAEKHNYNYQVYKLQFQECKHHNSPSLHGLWPEWDDW